MTDYGLPPDYVVNPVRTPESDTSGTAQYWNRARIRLSGRYQYAVYAHARELADARDTQVVVDFGCGPATKLCRFFGDRFRRSWRWISDPRPPISGS